MLVAALGLCAIAPPAQAFVNWIPLFNIKGPSMMPTLLDGDYVLTFPPGSNVAHPRGRVVVYYRPKGGGAADIKRIVGVAGDSLQMTGGVLHLNGQPVPRERLADFVTDVDSGRAGVIRRWRESLPGGISYETLDLLESGAADHTAVQVVPPGHYFMLGDNRDNSRDSRMEQVGPVPAESIIGGGAIIVFSVGGNASIGQPWRWPFEVRRSRLFSRIR